MQIPVGLYFVALMFSIIGISIMIMAVALLFDLGDAVLGVNDISNLAELFALLALGMLVGGAVLLVLGIAVYRGRTYGWVGIMLLSLFFVVDGALELVGATDTGTWALATLLAVYLLLPGVRTYFGIRLIKETRAI